MTSFDPRNLWERSKMSYYPYFLCGERGKVRDLPRFIQSTTFGFRHVIQGSFHSHPLFALSDHWKAMVTDHVRDALKRFIIPTLQCQNVESPISILYYFIWMNSSEFHKYFDVLETWFASVCVGEGFPWNKQNLHIKVLGLYVL